MLKSYTSEGVVIKRSNYGEGDRIITFLTKDKGKVTLIAKGVRKLKSRKRGHLEIFSRTKISVYEAKSMGILTETQVLDDYNVIRKDLNKVTLAYYFCEVINKITDDGSEYPFLYQVLIDNLDQISSRKNLKNLRSEFIEEVLISLGFWDGGQKLTDPDGELAEVLERKLNTLRVGRKMLS